jgi:ABC-type sugar transport system permease subunit
VGRESCFNFQHFIHPPPLCYILRIRRIISAESVDEIINRLKSITIEKQPFVKPKGIMFLGKIKEKTFRLMTFHSPPIRITFEIKESGVEFEYKIESIINTIKWVLYLISLPVLIGLLIWSFLSEKAGFEERIVIILLLILPFAVIRLFKWVYDRWLLPNDQELIKKLENELNVKIEKV